MKGDTFYRSSGPSQESHNVTGYELSLLFYDELVFDVEINGIFYARGGIYEIGEGIIGDTYYEKETIYEDGRICRLVYRPLQQDNE